MLLLTALGIGVFSVAFFPQLPALNIVVYGSLPLIFLCYYRPVRLIFAFMLGIFVGSFQGHSLLDSQLSSAADNQLFHVIGRIEGLPSLDQRKMRFTFRVTHVEPLKKDTPPVPELVGKRIRLSWYQSDKRQWPKPKTGQNWQLTVKLRKPRGFVNPAGFDYQQWLLQQHIVASGYVRPNAANEYLGSFCHGYAADCWRARIKQRVTALVEKNTIGPLLALLIGDKQFISEAQWQVFRETGTIHLMAISGLHIGLAAMIGFGCGSLFRRLGQAMRVSDHYLRWLPDINSVVFSLLYAMLAGFSLPTQRAMVMVLTVHLYRLCYRQISPWKSLGMAVFIIALIDPLAARSPGFWLSFIAVVVLVLSFQGYQQSKPTLWLHKLLSLGKAQLVLLLGLLPVSLLWLPGISFSSVVANFIAIPVVSLLITPLLFLSMAMMGIFPVAGESVLWLTDQMLGYLLVLLTWLSQYLPGYYYFDFGQLTWINLILVSLGIGLYLLPRGLIHPGLCLFYFLPLLFGQGQFVDAGKPPLRLSVMDVGQGTAVLVETPNHRLVYDTGKKYSDRFDSGKDILAPYIRQLGYQSIDRLLLSHGDSDHAGGALGFLDVIAVDDILAGEPGRTPGRQCIAGEQWRWDGVNFEILWPTQTYLAQQAQRESNNLSCVLAIHYQGKTILLAGDIEASVETQLLAGLTPVDVLLVPHHGSGSSSHPAWVRQLHPDYSIISAGYKNPHGHPDVDVLARYTAVNSQILATPTNGAIRLTLSQHNHWQLETWRQSYSRYWYD